MYIKDMRRIFLLAICLFVICAGCIGGKPAAESNPNITKAEQCSRILNAPDFAREALKNLNPFQAEFAENGTVTTQTCKPFETIICEGIEYRLYDVCLPSRRITCTIITEEDFL